MPFPYTYKNKIELLGDKIKGLKPDILLITDLLFDEISSIQPLKININENNIEYSDYATIFKYEYSVKFKIENEANDINIFYEINYSKLLNITLVVIVLFAFFSFVSIKLFLIFSGLFSVIFYFLNLIYINTFVKNLIERAVGNNMYHFSEDEYISEEQEKWIKDINRCPACGEYLSSLDLFCPDCGLRIKKNRSSLPIDSSKYKDKDINFFYKKNKKH